MIEIFPFVHFKSIATNQSVLVRWGWDEPRRCCVCSLYRHERRFAHHDLVDVSRWFYERREEFKHERWSYDNEIESEAFRLEYRRGESSTSRQLHLLREKQSRNHSIQRFPFHKRWFLFGYSNSLTRPNLPNFVICFLKLNFPFSFAPNKSILVWRRGAQPRRNCRSNVHRDERRSADIHLVDSGGWLL